MNTPHRLAVFFLVLALTLFSRHDLSAQSPTPPAYEIGSIPSQRVWYSAEARLEFTVGATALGVGTTVTATFDPSDGILGSRTFDTATGHFVYVPDPSDAESFTIAFRGTNGSTSADQIVAITPLRPLPPESAVFGLEPRGPLPDPAGNDFLETTTATIAGSVWFNGIQRTSLRDVTVVGHTVVLQEGHANGLWNFHDNADLRTLTIHAETVVVRGALRVPQTHLAIYAFEVRFEDQDGQPAASLSTVPLNSTTTPASRVNGRPGHNGGSLTLFADVVTGAGTTRRFILDGGKGEAAGHGVGGKAGANRSVVSSISNGLLPTWSWTNDYPTSGTIYAYYRSSFLGADTSKRNPSDGDPGYPEDGGPATAGGRPGSAGDGGAVLTNLDLSAWLQTRGGSEGTRAPFVAGGAAGRPRTAYKRYLDSDGQYNITSRFSRAGAGASGPASTKISGLVGAVTVLPGDLRWLDPLALQKVLLHLRRAYLAQHFDYVRETAADYVALIDAAAAIDAWSALPSDRRADLTQLRDELRTLHHRLASNLDYFGNPAGWVPMLSFEVNKLAFENEIPRALRVMYLNYWLGSRATTIQQKLEAMTKLRTELRNQVRDDRTAYADAVAAIPGLEFKATQVQNKINSAKTDIESLKNDLLPKAKNIALLKKTARALGAVAEIFPVGQPYVGAVGTTISQLTYIDPDDPWVDGAIIIGTNAAGAYSEAKANEKAQALKASTDGIDPEAENQSVTVAQLQTLQQPLLDVLGESINQIRNSQSPTPEVEAELQRLLADEPAYKALVKQLRNLNREKQDFATELAQTMQAVMRLSLAITRNLLTIDRLNRAIQEADGSLDPEVLGYLASMNERARDRLLKYHYFVARAYEYRMLQSYPGELDLTSITKKFQELATAGNSPELTADQFDSLRSVYEDQLSSVAFTIFNQYNSNRPTLSAPVELTVPAAIVAAINAGEPATINLADLGLFLPDQENVRIVNLEVSDLQVSYIGSQADIIYADIIFQHAGVSRLQQEGETWLFRHYNEDTRSKIEWTSRFNPFNPNQLDPVQPSAADQSLLKALLSTGTSTPSTDDLLLYSRPSADAELEVVKQVNGRFGADLVVTSMRIKVQYDFRRMSDQIKTLNVAATDDGPRPLVRIAQVDRNGRDNGEGGFERAYNVGSVVSISAEERIGQYVFDHWVGAGVAESTSAATTVSLTSSREVRPVYRLITLRTLVVSGGSGSGEYNEGDQVPIVAHSPSGQRFVRWEGSGIADPGASITTVTVADNTTVTAIYESIGGFSALVNISNRAVVGTGDDILIPGFVIAGSGTKKILVRAVGPTLAGFGVSGTLDDPQMTLFKRRPGTTIDDVVATNDNWGTNSNAAQLTSTAATLGAFPLASGSSDAALLVDVQPGQYSVVTSGVGNTSGVAIVEVYDADASQESARLVNISGRARVGLGDQILIPGFVVEGNAARRFLIRAVGPTLGSFGVSGTLADPQLTLYKRRPGTTIDDVVATNDNWGDAANAAAIPSTSAAVGAFPLNAGSADAVVLIDLEPGVYSATASGVGNTTGVAIVEVYEVTE